MAETATRRSVLAGRQGGSWAVRLTPAASATRVLPGRGLAQHPQLHTGIVARRSSRACSETIGPASALATSDGRKPDR